jgi:hypothetical protein
MVGFFGIDSAFAHGTMTGRVGRASRRQRLKLSRSVPDEQDAVAT